MNPKSLVYYFGVSILKNGKRLIIRYEIIQKFANDMLHLAPTASCMAENHVNEKVTGICFDGAGHGTDRHT